MAVKLSDDFNRADDASVGNGWTDQSETVKIDTNRLFVGAVGGAQNPYAYKSHGAITLPATMKFVIIPGTGTARQGYAGMFRGTTIGAPIGIRWQMGTNGVNNSITIPSNVSAATFSANFSVTQYIWIDLTANGSNMDIALYMATTDSKPGSTTATYSNAAIPTDLNCGFHGDSPSDGEKYYIDSVEITDSSIASSGLLLLGVG